MLKEKDSKSRKGEGCTAKGQQVAIELGSLASGLQSFHSLPDWTEEPLCILSSTLSYPHYYFK